MTIQDAYSYSISKFVTRVTNIILTDEVRLPQASGGAKKTSSHHPDSVLTSSLSRHSVEERCSPIFEFAWWVSSACSVSKIKYEIISDFRTGDFTLDGSA